MNDLNKLTDYAWAAGIIDGEGCVYILKGKVRKGSKNPHYSLKLRVSMTHMPTIQKLYNIFGGNYYEVTRKKKKEKNQAIWELSAQKARAVLDKVIDFLFTKKEEALVGIEFSDLPKAIKYKETPYWLLTKKEELYQKMRLLKRYRYEVTFAKQIKTLKKDTISNCSVCNKIMPQYHENGTQKIVCSDVCRFKKMKSLTDEQEQKLFEKYKTKQYTYKYLADYFGIKKCTLKAILRRFKRNASIPPIP